MPPRQRIVAPKNPLDRIQQLRAKSPRSATENTELVNLLTDLILRNHQ